MRWSRKRRWTAGVLMAVLLLGAIGYWQRTALALWGFDLFFAKSVERKLEKSYQPIDGRTQKEETAGQELKQEAKKPYTLLLLGVDQRGKERGRSDTVIMTVVRPADGAALMISVPRDAYVELPGRGKAKWPTPTPTGKPNWPWKRWKRCSAFRWSTTPPSTSRASATRWTPSAASSCRWNGIWSTTIRATKKFVVKAGKPVLQRGGSAQFRAVPGRRRGDISRTQRQKQFLEAVLAKATRMDQWTKIPELIDIMGDNFRTDIAPAELIEQAKWMLTADTRLIYSHTLTGKGRMINSLWYYVLDEEDVARATEWLQAWLDPAKSLDELPKPGKDETGGQNDDNESETGSSGGKSPAAI